MENVNTKEMIRKIRDYIDDPGPVGRNAREHLTDKQLNLLRGYITDDEILEKSLESDNTPLENITVKFYEGICELKIAYSSSPEDAIDDYVEMMTERWKKSREPGRHLLSESNQPDYWDRAGYKTEEEAIADGMAPF